MDLDKTFLEKFFKNKKLIENDFNFIKAKTDINDLLNEYSDLPDENIFENKRGTKRSYGN
jgi:hypothetical protein